MLKATSSEIKDEAAAILKFALTAKLIHFHEIFEQMPSRSLHRPTYISSTVSNAKSKMTAVAT
jgi:hypothetical protein